MGDLAQRSMRFTYTNWRGETAERWATPLSFRWGSTEWHPEPGWLMRAFDHDKGAEREFALADCAFRTTTPAQAAKVLLDAMIADQTLFDAMTDAAETAFNAGASMNKALGNALRRAIAEGDSE